MTLTHLLVNLVSKSAGLLLDSGDVSLELGANALELANDSALDRVGKVGVVISEELGLVADLVENLLPSSLSEELMTLVEATEQFR